MKGQTSLEEIWGNSVKGLWERQERSPQTGIGVALLSKGLKGNHKTLAQGASGG